MRVKKIYPYIFYKLYRFSEAAPSKWWSEWKASIALLALELWLIVSVFVYYDVIFKKGLPDDTIIVLVGGIIIAILAWIKYYLFYRNDRWRAYVKDFDQLPQRQNIIGTVLVCILILLIISNLIFSFYLMSQIDWSLYR